MFLRPSTQESQPFAGGRREVHTEKQPSFSSSSNLPQGSTYNIFKHIESPAIQVSIGGRVASKTLLQQRQTRMRMAESPDIRPQTTSQSTSNQANTKMQDGLMRNKTEEAVYETKQLRVSDERPKRATTANPENAPHRHIRRMDETPLVRPVSRKQHKRGNSSSFGPYKLYEVTKDGSVRTSPYKLLSASSELLSTDETEVKQQVQQIEKAVYERALEKCRL